MVQAYKLFNIFFYFILIMKIIKSFWFGGAYISSKKNFGDEIGPFIIRELSGCKVVYSKVIFIEQFISTFHALLKLDNSFFNYLITWFLPFNKVLLTVGSILASSNNNCIVWGSGFIQRKTPFKGGEILAVRGRLTSDLLVAKGYDKINTFGDPALLLPLIYERNIKDNLDGNIRIGVVPHYLDYDYFNKLLGEKYKIIDLSNRDFEFVLNEILSCNYILSTSLHGIIVSHAYNIPAIWIEGVVLEPEGFKFLDYFSSVNIPFYKGFKNIDEIFKNDIQLFFNDNSSISLPNLDISSIQISLLKVAPFPLKEKFIKK